MVVKGHSLLRIVSRVGSRREHLRGCRILEEIERQRLVLRDLVTKWVAAIARESSQVLETKAGAPERVEVAIVVLSHELLVDIIPNFPVAGSTTREKDSIDLAELLVSD